MNFIVLAVLDLIGGVSGLLCCCCKGEDVPKYGGLVRSAFLDLKKDLCGGVEWRREGDSLGILRWKSWRRQDAQVNEEMDVLALEAQQDEPDAQSLAATPAREEAAHAFIKSNPSQHDPGSSLSR